MLKAELNSRNREADVHGSNDARPISQISICDARLAVSFSEHSPEDANSLS